MTYCSQKNLEGKSHRKGWVFLRKDKETGKIEGHYDASICSMGWSSWVAIVYSYPIKQQTVAEWNRSSKKFEYFVARVGSKNCPIIVDWTARSNDRSTHKGNRPFIMKTKVKL